MFLVLLDKTVCVCLVLATKKGPNLPFGPPSQVYVFKLGVVGKGTTVMP